MFQLKTVGNVWNSGVSFFLFLSFLIFFFFFVEQIRNVRSSQEALRVAIGSLDNAKSRAEVERWTLAAAELKEKSDQLVLILQVGMFLLFAN